MIYRGVDPEAFPYGYKPDSEWLEAWYAQYPFLKGRKVLTLPGRLTRLKGHEDFIGLIADLLRERLDVHGLIVGHLDPARQSYINELQQQVSERGLGERVTFTGQRSDIRDIYAISDIVLSLSKKPESFGRTVLEALSLGVPVIGYGHGGVAEVLGKTYPTGVVNPDDRGSLSTTAHYILSGDAPLVRESRDFGIDRMKARTLELYSRVAGDK